MQPIGLTTKRSRNKYARERDGELMLIHRCTGCSTIVINRIAADDSASAILEIYDSSDLISAALRAELLTAGVSVLTRDDCELVRRRLFGDRQVAMQQEGVALAYGEPTAMEYDRRAEEVRSVFRALPVT